MSLLYFGSGAATSTSSRPQSPTRQTGLARNSPLRFPQAVNGGGFGSYYQGSREGTPRASDHDANFSTYNRIVSARTNDHQDRISQFYAPNATAFRADSARYASSASAYVPSPANFAFDDRGEQSSSLLHRSGASSSMPPLRAGLAVSGRAGMPATPTRVPSRINSPRRSLDSPSAARQQSETCSDFRHNLSPPRLPSGRWGSPRARAPEVVADDVRRGEDDEAASPLTALISRRREERRASQSLAPPPPSASANPMPQQSQPSTSVPIATVPTKDTHQVTAEVKDVREKSPAEAHQSSQANTQAIATICDSASPSAGRCPTPASPSMHPNVPQRLPSRVLSPQRKRVSENLTSAASPVRRGRGEAGQGGAGEAIFPQQQELHEGDKDSAVAASPKSPCVPSNRWAASPVRAPIPSPRADVIVSPPSPGSVPEIRTGSGETTEEAKPSETQMNSANLQEASLTPPTTNASPTTAIEQIRMEMALEQPSSTNLQPPRVEFCADGSHIIRGEEDEDHHVPTPTILVSATVSRQPSLPSGGAQRAGTAATSTTNIPPTTVHDEASSEALAELRRQVSAMRLGMGPGRGRGMGGMATPPLPTNPIAPPQQQEEALDAKGPHAIQFSPPPPLPMKQDELPDDHSQNHAQPRGKSDGNAESEMFFADFTVAENGNAKVEEKFLNANKMNEQSTAEPQPAATQETIDIINDAMGRGANQQESSVFGQGGEASNHVDAATVVKMTEMEKEIQRLKRELEEAKQARANLSTSHSQERAPEASGVNGVTTKDIRTVSPAVEGVSFVNADPTVIDVTVGSEASGRDKIVAPDATAGGVQSPYTLKKRLHRAPIDPTLLDRLEGVKSVGNRAEVYVATEKSAADSALSSAQADERVPLGRNAPIVANSFENQQQFAGAVAHHLETDAAEDHFHQRQLVAHGRTDQFSSDFARFKHLAEYQQSLEQSRAQHDFDQMLARPSRYDHHQKQRETIPSDAKPTRHFTDRYVSDDSVMTMISQPTAIGANERDGDGVQWQSLEHRIDSMSLHKQRLHPRDADPHQQQQQHPSTNVSSYTSLEGAYEEALGRTASLRPHTSREEAPHFHQGAIPTQIPQNHHRGHDGEGSMRERRLQTASQRNYELTSGDAASKVGLVPTYERNVRALKSQFAESSHIYALGAGAVTAAGGPSPSSYASVPPPDHPPRRALTTAEEQEQINRQYFANVQYPAILRSLQMAESNNSAAEVVEAVEMSPVRETHGARLKANQSVMSSSSSAFVAQPNADDHIKQYIRSNVNNVAPNIHHHDSAQAYANRQNPLNASSTAAIAADSTFNSYASRRGPAAILHPQGTRIVPIDTLVDNGNGSLTHARREDSQAGGGELLQAEDGTFADAHHLIRQARQYRNENCLKAQLSETAFQRLYPNGLGAAAVFVDERRSSQAAPTSVPPRSYMRPMQPTGGEGVAPFASSSINASTGAAFNAINNISTIQSSLQRAAATSRTAHDHYSTAAAAESSFSPEKFFAGANVAYFKPATVPKEQAPEEAGLKASPQRSRPLRVFASEAERVEEAKAYYRQSLYDDIHRDWSRSAVSDRKGPNYAITADENGQDIRIDSSRLLDTRSASTVGPRPLSLGEFREASSAYGVGANAFRNAREGLYLSATSDGSI